MQYRLKKDLPFVKASPYPEDNEGLEIIELEHKFIVKYIDCNFHIWQTDIPKNNAHLYLEEVKPREWWKIFYKTQNRMWGPNFRNREDAMECLGQSMAGKREGLINEYEVIKVREVL